MNTKKKVLSIALASSLAAVAIAGSSLAYFTAEDKATNVISIGNVTIDLTEPEWEKTGKVEAETMYPGEAVAKDPTVENTGKNPAFVRIKVEWPENVKLSTRTDYAAGISKDWEEKDGYYYYTGILAPEASTDALFDQIVLDPSTTNGDATDKEIVVTAEAVQAQGARVKWADVQTMTVDDIAAWFTTCMA